MKATGEFIKVKEISGEGVQVAGNNLKLGEVISIGERCKSNKEVIVDETKVFFKEKSKILFDANKALQHGGFWYLKGSTILAFE